MTLPASTGVDVGQTSTLLVAANAARDQLVLTNASDTGVWVLLGTAGAVYGMGIYLPAAGGQWCAAYSGPACAMHTGVIAGVTKRVGVEES